MKPWQFSSLMFLLILTAAVNVMAENSPENETGLIGGSPPAAATDENAQADNIPAVTTSDETAPIENPQSEITENGNTPTGTTSSGTASTESVPMESAPMESAPTELAPMESAPTGTAPTDANPLENSAPGNMPNDATPVEGTPANIKPSGTASTGDLSAKIAADELLAEELANGIIALPADDDADGWLEYGRYLAKKGKYLESFEAFEKAIRINPNVGNPYGIRPLSL